ncbi:EF-hand domain-containing protein [Streptomyces sp. NPDC050560]|uniref:EF-hand domain-containing protein n=1 Tax=Streptomyces sp. NPDC050560 TaxID=3365630 RepID=UPI00379EE99E
MRSEAINRVRLVFTLFDANGNGQLEADDFDLMTERVRHSLPDADEARHAALAASLRTYWTTLVTALDTDGDGRISFEEFQGVVLSPERFDAALDEFAHALAALGDLKGDGRVARPTFIALMTAIGFELSNVHALFDDFGPDGSDEITADTWVTGIKEYYGPDKVGIPGDRLVGGAA